MSSGPSKRCRAVACHRLLQTFISSPKCCARLHNQRLAKIIRTSLHPFIRQWVPAHRIRRRCSNITRICEKSCDTMAMCINPKTTGRTEICRAAFRRCLTAVQHMLPEARTSLTGGHHPEAPDETILHIFHIFRHFSISSFCPNSCFAPAVLAPSTPLQCPQGMVRPARSQRALFPLTASPGPPLCVLSWPGAACRLLPTDVQTLGSALESQGNPAMLLALFLLKDPHECLATGSRQP